MAAIVAWQLSIAVAEELCRGLVQSGVGFGLGAIGHLLAGDAFNDGIASIAGVACNGVALLMAGRVRLGAPGLCRTARRVVSKEQWFREATTYGLLWATLPRSGDRLLAPVCAHAASTWAVRARLAAAHNAAMLPYSLQSDRAVIAEVVVKLGPGV